MRISDWSSDVCSSDLVHVMGLDEQRLELRAAPLVAAGGQGPQGVAVVALAAGDDVAALRLALLDEVLSRHLQGRLDGFGTAARPETRRGGKGGVRTCRSRRAPDQ